MCVKIQNANLKLARSDLRNILIFFSKGWNVYDFCSNFLLQFTVAIAESQSQSADLNWQKITQCMMVTDSDFLASDYDFIQSEDIKHVVIGMTGSVWSLCRYSVRSDFKSHVAYSSLKQNSIFDLLFLPQSSCNSISYNCNFISRSYDCLLQTYIYEHPISDCFILNLHILSAGYYR